MTNISDICQMLTFVFFHLYFMQESHDAGGPWGAQHCEGGGLRAEVHRLPGHQALPVQTLVVWQRHHADQGDGWKWHRVVAFYDWSWLSWPNVIGRTEPQWHYVTWKDTPPMNSWIFLLHALRFSKSDYFAFILSMNKVGIVRDGYSNSTQCYLLPAPIKFKHNYNCPEFRER